MATALYPGAYKPPHRGHFEVVKKLLDGTHNGVQYNLSDMQSGFNKALQGDKDKVEKIDKVIVFIGGGVRNGISEKESKQVWDIYAKYLPNVEIVVGEKNPLNAAKHYAAEHPDEKFYAVTGVRSEEDYGDLRRIATFKNTPNVQGLIFPATGNPIRATNLRQAVLQGSLDNVLDFFPSQLSRQEMLNIMNILKQSIIAEIMAEKLDAVLAEMFQEEEEQLIQENSSGTPIAPQPIMRSEDRAKLVRVYEQLRDTLGDNFYNIEFKNDHVAVYLKEKSRARGFDYTPYMASILEYMIDSGMKISPLPEVKIKKDLVEAEDFFGKTAFYNPTKKEIVLYTQNRHPKDVMRSFAHEMIHHKQNLEGRLNNIGTTNTNEDDYLLEIEKEAYLEGNITFRNWEDSIKNEGKKKVMNEGRYDKISNIVSNRIFNFFKEKLKTEKPGDKIHKLYLSVNPYEDADIESDTVFDLQAFIKITDDEYSADGGANAGYDDDGDEITPLINVAFKVPTFINLQELSMDLKDVVRHEIEHLTQDGENLKRGKYIPNDQKIRDKIELGKLPKSRYYKLPKEIDAMIQGMYYKAKKSRTPFPDVVNNYFDKVELSPQERIKVKELWNKRLPALGIKQRL